MKDSKLFHRPIQISAFQKRYAEFTAGLIRDEIISPPTPPDVVRRELSASIDEFTRHVLENGMPSEWEQRHKPPEFAPAKWIAEYIGKSYHSTRKRLQRLGEAHPEYIRTIDSPRRGEPRLLYHVSESLRHLGKPVHDQPEEKK